MLKKWVDSDAGNIENEMFDLIRINEIQMDCAEDEPVNLTACQRINMQHTNRTVIVLWGSKTQDQPCRMATFSG